MKKKLFAVLLATAMTVVSAIPAMAEDAVTYDSVTYKFECTTFVAEDTITLAGQADSWGWQDPAPTATVTAAGDFEMVATVTGSGFKNMGYLSSANSVANIYKLEAIVINGVEFVFQADANVSEGKDAIYQTSTINAADGQMNGFPNIWNAAGQQAVIARSENGSTINGSNDTITITWAEADLAEPTPSETTPTPTMGDVTAVLPVAVLAVAAMAVVVVMRKKTVNE